MTSQPIGRVLAYAAVIAFGAASAARAEDLKPGDKAPPFSLQGSDGKTYTLDDFKGKQVVVLAWYPKAFTPGCTAECKSFAEKGEELKSMKVAFFTASVDAPEKNKDFAKSVGAEYPILSDPDKTVAKAYGVYNAERNIANRVTFYIGKDGLIKEVDKKINTPQAAPDVAAKVKSLGLADAK